MSRLPVISAKNTIRPSRSTRWRAGVLILVHLLAAAHISHWLIKGRTVTPVEPSEAAAFALSGVVNAGFIFFAVTIVLTAIFGRFFCGWACHLVALQDLARGLLEKFGRRPKPLRSRLLRWVPMIACFYAFFWPLIYRLLVSQPMPEIQTEFTTTEFWATFPGWIVAGLTFLICGFLAIYFLGAKGFCTYACPYGAIFGAVERVAPMRIRVTDACEGCGHCTAVCTSNVRVHEEVRDFGMVVDSGCMKCLDCVSVCPNDALYYGVGPLPLATKPRAEGRKMQRFPLSWAEEGVLGVAFTAAFFSFRGLYGQIPFLMALGLAAVLAFLVLLGWQLVTRPHLTFQGWRLKRGGALQPPAFALLAGMALLLVFWLHSATVRYYTYLGDAGYRSARARGVMLLDVVAPRPEIAAAERDRLARGLTSFEKVRQLGLFDSRGLDAKMAWMAALQGGETDPGREADQGREADPGREADLKDYAQAAIDHGDLVAEMHQLLGRSAFEAGDPGRAADHFERAVEADDNDPWARISLGVSEAQSGQLGQAKVTFETAVRDLGETATLAYNLGLVEAYAGRIDSAAAQFGRAVALDPRHLPARENLAGMLATMGRFEESVEQYFLAIEQAPEDAQTRLFLAQVLAALGRRDEAVEQTGAALRIAPGLPDALRLDAELRAIR